MLKTVISFYKPHFSSFLAYLGKKGPILRQYSLNWSKYGCCLTHICLPQHKYYSYIASHLNAYRELNFAPILTTRSRLSLEYEQTAAPGPAEEWSTDSWKETFPQVPVRWGQTLNKEIIECLVVMESCYKVEIRKSRELLQFIGNKLFHQEWITDGDSDFSMPSRWTINAASKTFIT